MKNVIIAGISALLLVSTATVASAATVTWNTWDTASSGTAGPISVTYNGPADLVTAYPTYTPASSFMDGSIVQNAPVAANNILRITGGTTDLYTLTFSAPVVNPVFAIWSLGGGNTSASFVFNDTPVIIAGGANAEYGGSSFNLAGNTVSGIEGNGTLQFTGTFSSISWTNPQYEYWYGFDVGFQSVAAVPEPSTWAMMLLGFCGLGFITYRRKSKPAFRFG